MEIYVTGSHLPSQTISVWPGLLLPSYHFHYVGQVSTKCRFWCKMKTVKYKARGEGKYNLRGEYGEVRRRSSWRGRKNNEKEFNH